MRRIVSGLILGILVLTAGAGSVLAKPAPPDVLDQSNTVNAGGYASGSNLGQTFTPQKDGLLTRVDFYMKGTGASTFVYLMDATGDVTSTISQDSAVGTSYAWVTFYFDYPMPVVKGTKYLLGFHGYDIAEIGYSGDTYAGGAALDGSSWPYVPVPDTNVKDFEFKTYVEPQATTLAWDHTQLTVGQTTAVKLTETLEFPISFNGAAPMALRRAVSPSALLGTRTVNAVSLPTWFAPNGITCSSQIDPADCTLANATGSGRMSANADGAPIVIELSGTVSPAAANAGTATASAQGCVDYPVFNGTLTQCVLGSASVQVVAPGATPRVTLPPTSTTQAPSNRDGTPMALLLVLMALAAVGSLASLAVRRR